MLSGGVSMRNCSASYQRVAVLMVPAAIVQQSAACIAQYGTRFFYGASCLVLSS